MIFKAKKVHDINEHVTETHKRPSLGKKVASAFKDAKQVLHKMANKWKNGRSHTPETVSKRVEKGFDTCTVPSVDDTTQQVEETCPSSGASPKENGGVWKQLKERILASGRQIGTAILNVFQKVKNAIWQGCVIVSGIMYDLCYFCLLLLGLIPLTIFAIVYGRLTSVNLVTFKFIRGTDCDAKVDLA